MGRFEQSKPLYTVFMFQFASILCSIYSQYPLQDSDPIFIEISLKHERTKAKVDCDAFLVDVVCPCFHQKNVFTTMNPVDKFGLYCLFYDGWEHKTCL